MSFTPETKLVREAYGAAWYEQSERQSYKEFDTWLARHDADLREQIAREIDAEREQYLTPHRETIVWPYANGLADAAGVVRRNGASA